MNGPMRVQCSLPPGPGAPAADAPSSRFARDHAHARNNCHPRQIRQLRFAAPDQPPFTQRDRSSNSRPRALPPIWGTTWPLALAACIGLEPGDLRGAPRGHRPGVAGVVGPHGRWPGHDAGPCVRHVGEFVWESAAAMMLPRDGDGPLHPQDGIADIDVGEGAGFGECQGEGVAAAGVGWVEQARVEEG
jgi:hypothetical protein